MHNLGRVAIAGLLLAACASKSTEITPSYISPVAYQNYTCQQLAQQAQALSARATQVAGAQDSKRTNDQIATGVAIVVFWPAAFLVGGDGVCTENSVRIDLVTESPNVSDDGRTIILLPGAVRLAV